MNHQKKISGLLQSDESAVKNLGVVDLSQVKTVADLLAKDGPLKQMFKGTLEKLLKAESFIGYPPHSVAGNNPGNSRNGKSRKTLKTSLGEAALKIPRDRKGSFEPCVIKKYQTNSNEVESKILTMSARGITTRDLPQTLQEISGIDLSPTFISAGTNKILPEISEWQTRLLEAI